MNKQQITKYLSVIRRACDLIEQQLEEDVSQAFDEVARDVTPTKSVMRSQPHAEAKSHDVARMTHLDSLMGIEEWIPSVPQFQADARVTECDMINRANAVLDMCLSSSIEGAHFLDYGCGDGYIASQAALRGAASVTGYDIVPSDHWQKLGNEKVNYTCDVKSLTPKRYNVIFLYDVLDHSIDPEGIMTHIKYLTPPKSVVYVRCHPWVSKHASHLPRVGLNKAYIHLFFTFDELVERGFKPLFTRIEKNPIEAYRWWFKNFKVVKEKPIYEEVHDFFKVPAFKELLASEQQIPIKEIDGFLEQLRLQFVDYLLEA